MLNKEEKQKSRKKNEIRQKKKIGEKEWDRQEKKTTYKKWYRGIKYMEIGNENLNRNEDFMNIKNWKKAKKSKICED